LSVTIFSRMESSRWSGMAVPGKLEDFR